jgi:hypothetical protein
MVIRNVPFYAGKIGLKMENIPGIKKKNDVNSCKALS